MKRMNYVAGAAALMDRGDGPAQVVLDRTARSLAQRVADETRTELTAVLKRVDNIYGNFDTQEELAKTDFQYANDLLELEEIIQDAVKKKKYQSQVTVFIVGYENVCGQKLRLLQQVNEFFMDNANKFEEEEVAMKNPEIDLEECHQTIEETLKTTEGLAKRLGDLNTEMAEYMYEWAKAQANTNPYQFQLLQQKMKEDRGKKKLERSLGQARSEISSLAEKLEFLQEELEEKEDRIQQMFKQIELKNMEAQRYKTAAEVAKRSAEESDSLRDALGQRDEQIMALRKEVDQLKQNLESSDHVHEDTHMRMHNMEEENTNKMERLQQAMDQRDREMEEAQRELQRVHESQIEEIKTSHKKEFEELKNNHQEEIKKLLAEKEERDKEASKEKKPKAKSKDKQRSKLRDKRGAYGKKDKKEAEPAVSDEALDAAVAEAEEKAAKVKKSSKHLDPVFEEIEFEDEFDLTDDESWTSIPPAHMQSRFNQFRKLTKSRLAEFEGQLETTIKKTQRKVETLKAQFHEHKKKWEKERETILSQAEQAVELQTDAEKEAERALTQLEDFITEQEELEKEEEAVRQALENGKTPVPPPMSVSQAEQRLQEVQNADTLLAQTDDAKAEQSRKESSGEKSVIEGSSPEEISRSSALSRASLRNQHRDLLDGLKRSAQERRAKSPAGLLNSMRSQKSILSDLELDEDGDMPFPDDRSKEEREKRERKLSLRDIGTSPMSKGPRKQIPMHEHPVVQEYLKSYSHVTDFKDNLSRLFTDREVLIAGQLLAELEAARFDEEEKVQPQIELMTTSILTMLEEIYQVISSLISNEREYPVSSLYNLSRDPTRSVLTRNTQYLEGGTKSRTATGMEDVGPATGTDSPDVRQLKDQCRQLQDYLKETDKKHAQQLNHNTVVMMEMQDTINALQRELAALGEKQPLVPESAKDTPIIFSRLDSERNAAVMKRALNDERLDVSRYQAAVRTMDAYTEIPSKRLANLAQKYMHHKQMKEIEESVRHSNSLDDKVLDILDKMEALQNERARRWAEKMDGYTAERMKLANMLMVTLDDIERESGIFLIKPMFSYRSPLSPELFKGKLCRPFKPARDPSVLGFLAPSSLAPLPTPADNNRQSQRSAANHPSSGGRRRASEAGGASTQQPQKDGGVMGQQNMMMMGDYPRPVWNPNESSGKQMTDEQLLFLHQTSLNTPRILELDINRMLIGQNQISTRVPSNLPISNDRLVNAANTTTRAYVTINRPTGGATGGDLTDRPRSHTGVGDAVPPTTPLLRGSTAGSAGLHKKPLTAGKEESSSRNLPSTPPLPPITPRGGRQDAVPTKSMSPQP